MSRNRIARLEKMEDESLKPLQGLIVIRHMTVEADGSTLVSCRFETFDGKYRWKRGLNESAADFESRVSDDADRIANHGTVVFLPYNERGL
jgi:hypothetical protein